MKKIEQHLLVVRIFLAFLVLIGLTISSTSELCIENCGRFNLSSVWDPCCDEPADHSQDDDLEDHHHCNGCSDFSPSDTFINPKNSSRKLDFKIDYGQFVVAANFISVVDVNFASNTLIQLNAYTGLELNIGSVPDIMIC